MSKSPFLSLYAPTYPPTVAARGVGREQAHVEDR